MDAFDKHIKSLFDNHELPVDTQEMWQNVEPKLKKGKFPGRLLFLLLLLISIPVTFIFLTSPGQYPEQTSLQNKSDKNSYFGRKGQLINSNTKADTQQTKKITYGLKEKQNNYFSFSENSIQKDPNTQLIQVDHLIRSVKENDVKAESKVNTFSSDRFEKRPRIIYSTKKVATNTEIQPVISLSERLLNGPEKSGFKNNAFKWSVDLFTGFDYAAKILEAKTYDYRWYAREREQSENYLEAFNFGFHFNMHHKSGLIGGTGLVYHQIDEIFESSNSRDVETFKEGIIEIITNADGSSSIVSGQKLIIEHKSWNKKKFNNYGFINIPLFVGYAHNAGTWQLEISSGVDFNLAFIKHGEIIGKEGFPVSVSNPQNSIYRRLTSVNLNGGIKLLYPLSDRFNVFIEPNFHYNLYSLTQENNPLHQKYFHTGLRIGTRLHL